MQGIGVFDSGFGGLTILESLQELMPEYDFMYLGDNARAPYGEKSFDQVNEYTKEAIDWLLEQGCPMVILACNTASALALRNIQQIHLKQNHGAEKRVLGVVRPTTEIIGNYSKANKIGLLGTPATVESNSYGIEVKKFFPKVSLYQESCPLWVPMIENHTYHEASSKIQIQKNCEALLKQDKDIDTILLACTHYPILLPIIKQIVPKEIQIVTQGDIVAKSLLEYLHRHPKMDESISKNKNTAFYTTETDINKFKEKSTHFYKTISTVRHANLALNDT
jgi:glutamate racemase